MDIGSPSPDPLDQLDRLLGEIALDEAMLLGEVDGLLAALLVLPGPIAQAEWLPLVWGGPDQPAPDETEAKRVADLLGARKVAIVGELLRGEGEFEPVFEVDPFDDDPLREFWIEGFEHGIALRPDAWEALLASDDPDVATAAAGLAALIDLAHRPRKARKFSASAPDMIPAFVETLYRRQRGLMSPVRTPGPFAEPAISRRSRHNARCACGSGKKVKNCCGTR